RGQTDASRYGPAGTGRHGSPVARGSARRDRAASAVATRVCVLPPFATTAPDPHSKTPLEAPLVDRGACIIRAFFPACVTSHANVHVILLAAFFPLPRLRGKGGSRHSREPGESLCA